MSFSSETRAELMSLSAHRRCCRRALVAGLMFDADTDNNNRTLISLSTDESALFAAKAASSVFGGEAVPCSPVKSNGKCYDVAVISKEAAELAGKVPDFICEECKQNFLRGVLIASASITDPDSQYHLEILLNHTERAQALSDCISEIFGQPITVTRRSGTGLIYKSSAVIEDILSAAGAMQAYFSLLNRKIKRELRNNANRATNCETRNIANSVVAAERQMAAIDALEAAGELILLSQELRETAQLRKLYPDMPLSELATKHCPPISKSGINHRMEKLLSAADKLKGASDI